jgi:AcrR family transcriptional regulator
MEAALARRRLIPDEAVLDAANRIMRRVGPGGLTFALVSSESGLAPATLVQRFAGKELLVRAAVGRAWDLLDASIAFADEAYPVTSAGAMSLLVGLSAGFADLDFTTAWVLRADLREAQWRSRGANWRETLCGALGRRLTADPAEQASFGRLLANQWQGAMIGWSYAPDLPLAAKVREDLDVWWEAMGRARPVAVELPAEQVPEADLPEETPTERIIRLYGDG